MADNPPSYEMSAMGASMAKLNPTQLGLDNPTYNGTGDDTPQTDIREDMQLSSGTQPIRPAYQDNQSAAVWHTGQNTTVVVNQPGVGMRPGPVQLVDGAGPVHTICFNCGDNIITYIYYEVGNCTYLSCILLACIGCDLGCCLLPFCLDYFKDATHKCPRCHMILGKHKKM